jgi:hypothetical protein
MGGNTVSLNGGGSDVEFVWGQTMSGDVRALPNLVHRFVRMVDGGHHRSDAERKLHEAKCLGDLHCRFDGGDCWLCVGL